MDINKFYKVGDKYILYNPETKKHEEHTISEVNNEDKSIRLAGKVHKLKIGINFNL